MEAILKSPQAQRIIDFVAPIYGESYTALWLFEVIGRALDDVAGYAATLQKQAVPDTATWTLPYWEKEYGITPDPAWTEEQRQKNILAKIKYVPPVNPQKLAEFASAAAGVPCRVIENVSKNTFRIEIDGNSRTLERLQKIIEEAKPAHLIWSMQVHTPPVETRIYVAGVQIFDRSRTVLPLWEPERNFITSVYTAGIQNVAASRVRLGERQRRFTASVYPAAAQGSVSRTILGSEGK